MLVDVLWAAWDGRGLEHLRLDMTAPAARADGLLIAVDEGGRPFRARYAIDCDDAWRVRRARIEVLGESGQALDVRADGRGHWTDSANGAATALDGCVDIDIFPTPFTNTLPTKRFADGAPGRPITVDVAWVVLPALTIHAVRQEYTLLERGPQGTRWRFRDLRTDFVAELETDRHGLVLDYPEIARRVL